jgi:hypothetical protein
MVRAKPRDLVNAIYHYTKKTINSKQFNRDEGDEKDVNLLTKVSTKINAETRRR